MRKPNFIIFLTDDQGYGDLSCMGATDFRTPHLDGMAREGVRFTDWYSNSPVCSPSRAALLTGRYPGNAGVRAILAGHRTATGLPTSTPSLAKALGDLGYQTRMAGKWHLGVDPGSQPHSHCFDHWYGFLAGCIDYYSHIFYWGMNKPGPGINPTHDLWEDGEEIWNNGQYFTEAIRDRAIAYLREAVADERPFFLYVPFNAPHYPMHAPEELMARFDYLPWDRQVMAAMIASVDDAIGEIMAEVERLGQRENTITFFTADNGPSRESRNWLDGTLDPYYGGSAGKLRGHKFSLFDGGIRVPAILHGPGHIEGGQVSANPCVSMDIFPTFLGMAGGDPGAYELDGVDILPGLEGDAEEREIYWEMENQTAVRRGKWKLVLDGQLVEGAPAEDAVHLADLEADMGERNNLAGKHPELTAELKNAAESWRAGIEERWDQEYAGLGQGVTTYTPGYATPGGS